MTTKLRLYNRALRIVGERSLASLTENREPRRYLDEAWNDDAIGNCLQMGLWKFAKRTRLLTYSPSVSTTDFGYQFGFELPDDFVRTMAVASDPYFHSPLLKYEQEAGFLFADIDTIYFQYVSDDDQYGNDMSLWPPSFADYVAHYLALEISPRIKNNTDRDKIEKKLEDALAQARSHDAMEEPTKFPPRGSWVNARSASFGSRR